MANLSTGATIAEAVLFELQQTQRTLTPAPTFSRVYVPQFNLPDLTTARVQVITPSESELLAADRGSETEVFAVSFLVVAQARADDVERIDALMLFVQNLQNQLRRHDSERGNKRIGGARWVPPHVNSPKFDYQKLNEEKIFLSGSTFTYQITRSF